MKARTPNVRHAFEPALLLIVGLAASLPFPLFAAQKPLNRVQLDGLVRGGVASVRIANLVRKRGISFEVTPGFLKSLQADGAHKVLVDELRKEGAGKADKGAPPDKDFYQAQALRIKGKGFFDHQLWTPAKVDLRKSIQLNPDDPAAHFYLGRTLLNTGNLDGAIAQYRQAILLAPDAVPIHFDLGNALLMKRDFKGAVEQYRESVELSPQDPRAYYALGAALFDDGDNPGAVAEFQTALRLNPASEKAHLALGLALDKENSFKAAIREYRLALKINPRDSKAHADLAAALLAAGERQAALQELRAAMSLAPADLRYQTSYEKLVSQPDPASPH